MTTLCCACISPIEDAAENGTGMENGLCACSMRVGAEEGFSIHCEKQVKEDSKKSG